LPELVLSREESGPSEASGARAAVNAADPQD
jgi:hypothetical protein